MKFSARITSIALLASLLLTTTGCRYLSNRYYDFRDTFAVGVGVSHESKRSGVVPPSLGVYLELTDLLQFGAITHTGSVAELDLRGSYAGPESSTRVGFLWWQSIKKYQAYDEGCENAFKRQDFPWCERMESLDMSNLDGKPAKRLHYQHWSNSRMRGTWLLHRGWQYWEYTGVEFAICDPFLTHFGVMTRFGIDVSELSDFALGWLCIDYKHDDMTRDEYVIFRQSPDKWGLKLVPARPRRENMPPTEDGIDPKPVTPEAK